MDRLESFDAAASGVITLGAWVALRDARGDSDPDVWSVLHSAAVTALDAVKHRLRAGERDEVLSDLDILVNNVPASWRDPRNADAPLSRWLITVAKRCLSRLRKAALRCLGDAADELPAAGAMTLRGLPASTRLRDEDAALLTPKQRAAYELRLQGLKHREIAERTGNSPGGVKDLLRRARKHLVTRIPAPRRHDPEVLAQLAARAERHGDLLNAALLRLRAAGTVLRECAARMGITLDGVRGRLKRWWSLRPRACDAHFDTCLPYGALPCNEGAGAAPADGDRDGVSPAALARGRSLRPLPGDRRRDPP